MSLVAEHPNARGVTYFEHWDFAIGIAWRLLLRLPLFALHTVEPFITIRRRLDLEATSAFLLERNHFIETAAATAHGSSAPSGMPTTSGRGSTAAAA